MEIRLNRANATTTTQKQSDYKVVHANSHVLTRNWSLALKKPTSMIICNYSVSVMYDLSKAGRFVPDDVTFLKQVT